MIGLRSGMGGQGGDGAGVGWMYGAERSTESSYRQEGHCRED